MDRETMLGKVTGKVVGLSLEWLRTLYDLVEKACGEGSQKLLEELRKFLRHEPTWVKRLLRFVRNVELPAIPEFRFNDIIECGKIGSVGVVFSNNFKKVFGKKVENDIPAENIMVHELVESSYDEPIIAELGGKQVATVKLGQVLAFISLQGRPKKSAYYIFYVEDDKGDVWAVSCRWDANDGDGDVDAYSTSDPVWWGAGRFVVSRF